MPSISTIKIIIDILTKVLNFCQIHRISHVLISVCAITTLYIVFNEFYLKNRFYEESHRNSIIYKKIGDIVQSCGVGSYVSWSTIKGVDSETIGRKMRFNDIVGCLSENKDHCPASIKYSNKIYLKEYRIGLDDYANFSQIQDGMIISCPIKDGNAQCPEYTPSTLNSIVKLTNLKLSNINYVLVKNWRDDLIYIFTLSFSSNAIPTCTEQNGNILLDSLARTAIENI